MATKLSDAFTSLLNKITNTDANVSTLATKIDDVKTAVENVATDSTTDNEAIATLSEKLTTVQEALESKIPSDSATSDEVSEVKTSVESVNTALTETKAVIDTMNETVAALRTAVESLDATFTPHTIEVKATGVASWASAASSDETIATTSIKAGKELLSRYQYESGSILITSVAPGTVTITAKTSNDISYKYYSAWFGVNTVSTITGTIVVTVAEDGSITVDQPFNYGNKVAPVAKVALKDATTFLKSKGTVVLTDYEGNTVYNSNKSARTRYVGRIAYSTNISTDTAIATYDSNGAEISGLDIDTYSVVPIFPKLISDNQYILFSWYATSGTNTSGAEPVVWIPGDIRVTTANNKFDKLAQNQDVNLSIGTAMIIDTAGIVDEYYRYPLKELTIDSDNNSMALKYYADVTQYRTVINKTFSFTSYSSADATESLGTGTVKVTDIDFDKAQATVTVLTNSVDGFAGNSYMVKITDYTSDRIELFTTDGTSTGMYVELQE